MAPARRVIRMLATFLLAAALPAGGAAGGVAAASQFHPAIGPHIRWTQKPAQPTTQDCLDQIGIRCYSPNQIQAAYDMAPAFGKGLDGSGKTIAIVDAFGSPTIGLDLQLFDQEYGLPDPPHFNVITPAGAPPPFDVTDADQAGWALEESLDVEYAHAMAPGADILVVNAPSDDDADFLKTEAALIANYHVDVLSQSFGETEFVMDAKIRKANDAVYALAAAKGVSIVTSTGDDGSSGGLADGSLSKVPVVSYPAVNPFNTAVGGTALTLDDAGNRLRRDVVWNETFDPVIVGPTPAPAAGGGGVSGLYGRPSYQAGAAPWWLHGRTIPDVSLSASVDGGVLVWETFDADPGTVTIYIVGGTSEAAPLFGGIAAVADQAAHHDLGLLNPALYALADGWHTPFVDITKGNNAVQFTDAHGVHNVPGYAATKGYDLASGIGTVDGSRLIKALAGH
jgi:subtilase family serine protease